VRRRLIGCDKSGAGALELGLVAPFLTALCVGIADFGFAYEKQLQLSGVVDAGAQYAFTEGQTETGTALDNDVSGFLSAITPLPLSAVTIVFNNNDANASDYYCLNGNPATYTGPYSRGTSCADGSGSTAGQYVSVSASFTYTPLFPADKLFFSKPFTQTVYVRLQ
jgi:Flp pilus assembly protein TadG